MFKSLFEPIIKFFMDDENHLNVLSSIFAVIAGLFVGLIIMLFTNPSEALFAFATILVGGFLEGFGSIGDVLFFATPIILTGLAVGFAFKTGLFNIGASGQLMVGALVAVYVGIHWTFLPASIHWLVAFLLAGLAGAIWATIPGLLKAYRNVHEVVGTIMMNYIGLYFVTMVIEQSGTWKFTKNIFNSLKNETFPVKESAVIPSKFLFIDFERIFGANSVNFGFIIAIIIVAIIYIILNHTTFGYELKSVGFNKDASKYAGINEKRSIVLSMAISGLLAGFAGALIFLNDTGRHLEVLDTLIPEGFDGIPVALIGLSNPIGVFFAAIFIGWVEQGGWAMQQYAFDENIIDIIISSIIYFSALVVLFKHLMNSIYKMISEKVITEDEVNTDE